MTDLRSSPSNTPRQQPAFRIGGILRAHFALVDPRTREVVFYSSCDPFDTKTLGSQIFAMRPDGTRLRQLTATRGRVPEASGAVSVELPGPIAYSARLR